MGEQRLLSRLEQLPNELLHRVFLDSQNLDLPATSTHLTQALNAHALKIEYCLRALYKPLSQLRDKWDKHAEVLLGRWNEQEMQSARDRGHNSAGGIHGPSEDDLQSEGDRDHHSTINDDGHESNSDDELITYDLVKSYTLHKLHVVRWKDYRRVELQGRLINSRFFNWTFFQELTRKAHPIFQKELINVHTALRLKPSEMSRKESWFTQVDVDELLSGMQSMPSNMGVKPPDFRQHFRLPWLRFRIGVELPLKCTRGPWLRNEDLMLYWLIQADCGISHEHREELSFFSFRRRRMLPLPPSMLAEAVRTGKEWLVFLCAIRAQTRPNTDMLRQAVRIKPFPFSIVQNLLSGAQSQKASLSEAFDVLDPQIWAFIEQQEQLEATVARQITVQSKVKDCISVAKWLRLQLQKYDQVPSDDSDALNPYLPLGPPIESVLTESLGSSADPDMPLGQIPPSQRQILILPDYEG